MAPRLGSKRRRQPRLGGYLKVRGCKRSYCSPRRSVLSPRRGSSPSRLFNANARESRNGTTGPDYYDELQSFAGIPVGFLQFCENAPVNRESTKSSAERSLLRPTRRLGGGGRCFAMHTSLKGGARNSSRRLSLFWTRGPPPKAAARAKLKRRAGRPDRRANFPRGRRGGRPKPPTPCSHAARGGCTSPSPSWASATSALSASSCRTLAAEFTLPTPPRVV